MLIGLTTIDKATCFLCGYAEKTNSPEEDLMSHMTYTHTRTLVTVSDAGNGRKRFFGPRYAKDVFVMSRGRMVPTVRQ